MELKKYKNNCNKMLKVTTSKNSSNLIKKSSMESFKKAIKKALKS